MLPSAASTETQLKAAVTDAEIVVFNRGIASMPG
jgi:hypothetical protein